MASPDRSDDAKRRLRSDHVSRESTNFDGAEAQARESALPDGDSQAELAHANRVATIGYLTASIVHDVKQPIATMVTNAQAALHFLDRRELDEAREALSCIVRDGARAEALVERTHDFAKKVLGGGTVWRSIRRFARRLSSSERKQ